jgi:flagellar motility protein MotE (MotC chaperone)
MIGLMWSWPQAFALESVLNAEAERQEKIRQLFDFIEKDESRASLLAKQQSISFDLNREIRALEQERMHMDVKAMQKLEMERVAKELDSKLKELEVLRAKLEGDINDKDKNKESMTLLVSLYESLSPDQAASLLVRLPVSTALTMIRMMNPKKTGKIIAAMEPKIAAELSKRLLRTPIQVGSES